MEVREPNETSARSRHRGQPLRQASRAFAVLLLGLALAAWAAPDYQVIVNAQNPVKALDRDYLEDVFLKRITHWPDGSFINPVDQRLQSPARQAFTEDVFNRPVAAIHDTWVQAIFAGSGIPPPELDTDAAVVEYVKSHPGAIGYVSAAAHMDGTHAVTVQ